MIKFKSIQATPELTGKDAICCLNQACKLPSQTDINKNKKLVNILDKIRR